MPSALVQAHPAYAASAAAGFHQRVGWGSRPALVVIDVCRAYWAAGSPLSLLGDAAGAASPESMRRVVAAARAGGVPVVWCQVRYTHPAMADGGQQHVKTRGGITIWQVGDRRGMDAWMPGLGPEGEEVVVEAKAGKEDIVLDSKTARSAETILYKKTPSAFFATNLAAQLTALGADSIVLCGVSTSGCVRATAVDACGHGFACAVVDEASGDRSAAIQQATLFDLDARFADVVSEAEAVERLGGGWR